MSAPSRTSRRIAGRIPGLRRARPADSDERFAERFAQQWAAMRSERRADDPPPIRSGESNFAPARVPYGMDLAAAWSWRFVVVVAAGFVVVRAIGMFSEVVLPLVIALLLSALVAPLVTLLSRVLPRGPSALLVVLGTIAVVALLL